MVLVPGAKATVPSQPRIPVPVPAAKASPPTCPPGAGLQSKLKPPPSRPSLLLDGHKHTSNERERAARAGTRLGVGRVRRGGKESPSPDRLAHLPHLCNLARSNQRSYKLLDWTVPTRCSCPSVWPVCLPASFFRRIITNIPLSLFPSTHPVIIPSAAPCLLARLVSQADPGGSQFPSPFLILSTPPLERSTLDARTWSNPLSFESRSNPIQSGPASPAQSCPVLSSQSPIRPSQSPPPTHSPKDRQDYLEQILPLCCCFLASPLAFAARRSPLARPAGPGTRRPLPHQTLQLSIASSIPPPPLCRFCQRALYL